MKKFIGYIIAKIGGFLWWHKDGMDTSDNYDDINVIQKAGYNLFCCGTKMMLGVKTMDDVEAIMTPVIDKLYPQD